MYALLHTHQHSRTRALILTHARTAQVLDQGAMMHKGSYIRSGWNVLDLTIVVAGLTDFTLTQAWAAPRRQCRSAAVARRDLCCAPSASG